MLLKTFLDNGKFFPFFLVFLLNPTGNNRNSTGLPNTVTIHTPVIWKSSILLKSPELPRRKFRIGSSMFGSDIGRDDDDMFPSKCDTLESSAGLIPMNYNDEYKESACLRQEKGQHWPNTK
jgi:hypothetical protein